MRNSLKVAKWEIKRNLLNKSFLISLFLTPVIFLIFFTVPMLFQGSNEPEPIEAFTVYIQDELNLVDVVRATVQEQELEWSITLTDQDEEAIVHNLREAQNTAYLPLTETALSNGLVQVYMSPDIEERFIHQVHILEPVLRQLQLERLGLAAGEIELVIKGIAFEPISVATDVPEEEHTAEGPADPLKRIIPGAFAGLILFSVVITGMMIFQSASQEKKEKVAEMVLSSITPTDLMQGKIIGYFVLGMIQVLVWLCFAIPLITWRFEWPVVEYLFVPELLILLFIAFAGYLLFAAVFVGIGATVEDMTASSNFQGMVFMLPWIPFIFMGPILSDPSGLLAQIASYFPLSAPGVLLIRLSIMDQWPWIEIMISIVIMVLSIWLFMKLAGKIFKTGILMYGKNATPREILKWLRH